MLTPTGADCFASLENVNENTPFYTKYSKGSDGKLVVGQTLSYKQVAELPFISKLIKNEYFEV